jgi:hypothetical protein
MKPLLPWVGAPALGAGLLFAAAPSSHAAPAQSLLPGLESNEDAPIALSIAEGIATALAAAYGACSASAAVLPSLLAFELASGPHRPLLVCADEFFFAKLP